MVMPSEFWFIPLDILMVSCTTFVVLLASTFFLIVLLTESCRSVPILLALNSFISEALFGLVMFSMALFTLKNDVQRSRREDSLCIVRGYLSYALSAVRSHSYLLQSVYRYITIVHPSDLFWQSSRLQLALICITWLISMVHPFPFLFTGQITYNADNQVCHMPLQKYHFIFYTCFFAYLNPITIIVVIYVKTGAVRSGHESTGDAYESTGTSSTRIENGSTHRSARHRSCDARAALHDLLHRVTRRRSPEISLSDRLSVRRHLSGMRDGRCVQLHRSDQNIHLHQNDRCVVPRLPLTGQPTVSPMSNSSLLCAARFSGTCLGARGELAL